MKSWIATEDEIAEGKVTDIYFIRTMQCLTNDNLDKTYVCAEITAGSVPNNGKYLLFLGLNEVLNLLKRANIKVDVYAIQEGELLPARDIEGKRIPVIVIEGPYGEFAIYETSILGTICYQSGVGTTAVRLRQIAKDKILLSFGIRRMPPAIAPIIDRACYIAGFDGISCVLSAEKLGIKPVGTIPHALIIIEGGIEEAVKSFDRNIDPDVPRIALVDTFNDEKVETMKALEAIGEKLKGIRLDTPSSRRGNWKELISEIKWELRQKGREDIKIYISGGLKEETIIEYHDYVDGFGVGTSLSNSPTIDFALDIVEVNGSPIAKRGKFAGKKQVGYCKNCDVYLCDLYSKDKILCPKCGKPMKKLLRKVMEKGEIIAPLPSEQEIRAYVLEQLNFKSVL